MSNVGHHGKFELHRLRSASNRMHLLSSASFHSRKSAKCLARLPAPLSRFRGSFAGSFFALSSAHGRGGASRVDFRAMRSSEGSQLVGAAEYGSVDVSLSASIEATEAEAAKSRVFSSSGRVLRIRAMPNPSIERDVQGLSPLAAPHVKR